ncbi:MAG: hypothetical protein HFJ28_07095 [Clostridia bacterium]|nr:hypothetical protein [Clostridia bacterium]
MNKEDKAGNLKNDMLDKKREIENNKKVQTRKMKEEIGEIEEIEDVTKYGEFVSSYFAWLTLEKQKQKAKEMEDITDK